MGEAICNYALTDIPGLGRVAAAVSAGEVVVLKLDWEEEAVRFELLARGFTPEQAEHPLIDRTFEQLTRYVAGEQHRFELPLRLDGTEFQQQVWRATAAIPFGETRSYGDIARRIGRPNAARAVGGALGHNHLPIVIPCHRVVASDGSLGGFTGGLHLKERLLAIEGSPVVA